MALSNVSTHKVAYIFAPIDNPKTAESKQLKFAITGLNFSYIRNTFSKRCYRLKISFLKGIGSAISFSNPMRLMVGTMA